MQELLTDSPYPLEPDINGILHADEVCLGIPIMRGSFFYLVENELRSLDPAYLENT